ncbi:GTP-binding protein Rho3 [Psilocybe cubensis]|uniref:GTP-binding protein Rho3 n=1 Tax=Psilocybe cubensis TaxID=181762 RepID=A0ACB8GV62_PSICU|nr:GTP-binding protein Rho3 [Psilocybe cubensis]KAH9479628.1 GTP-binding protein Rho3 [Psilocybe cubensis]
MSLCGASSKGASFGRGRPIQRKKVVVCGDGACGKTSLLNVFTRGFFTQVYEPTVFENYVHDIYVDEQVVELSLWDTAALKCDLRDDPVIKERLKRYGTHTVQYEEGLAVARRIRASRYLECSSKHNRGVTEVFYEAARVSLSTRTKGSGDGGCQVM